MNRRDPSAAQPQPNENTFNRKERRERKESSGFVSPLFAISAVKYF
jgi:hypothetical protein